jgi:threonine/homoserine/homoserine lactone efflux protein
MLGLIFNGHFHLEQVVYLDGQLVDLSNPDAWKAALSSGRAIWRLQYGNIELPGWYYAWLVPMIFVVGAFLLSRLIFKSLLRNRKIS